MTTSVLYDAPGPRTKRRILVWSVISAAVLAGVIGLGLWQFAEHGQLDAAKWAPFTQWPIWEFLFTGLLGTLWAAAYVAVLSAFAGIFLALGRLSGVRVVHVLATGYIEIARTLPVLLMIYVTLFALPNAGVNLPLLWKLVLPLAVANSAAFAELFRAGILALPSGQSEAALSLGLSSGQTMRLVVLPQAVRHITPSLVSQLVSLLKDTSLGYIVAFTELLYRAQVLSAYNHLLVQTFLVVTFIYLVCNGALSFGAHRLRGWRSKREPEDMSG